MKRSLDRGPDRGWIRHTELLGIEVEGINDLLGRLDALNMASRC